MKDFLEHLDKAFEHRVRLGMASLLAVNEQLTYGDLKEKLDLTDGNLATHMRSLVAVGYVTEEKAFVNRKPQTTYALTPAGREALVKHLEALEALLKSLDT